MTGEEAQASGGRSRFRRPGRVAVAMGAAVIVIAVVAGVAMTAGLAGTPASPSPSLVAEATPTPWLTASPTILPSPTASPTAEPTPEPIYLEATTSGRLIPVDQSILATRHPIAVMIDDQIKARPQAGLSQADVVYQAPAESGIPRYMAIFQTTDPELIGPIRSARLYFVAWAEEWRATYVHVGGATNAQQYLYANNGRYVFNADEIHWGIRTGYFDRVSFRVAPHNVFSSGARLQKLGTRIGAIAPMNHPIWTFTDGAPLTERPLGGTISVPYYANQIAYRYDQATNTYIRSVTVATNKVDTQVDYGNGEVVAPTTVVVLWQNIGPMAYDPTTSDARKGRLEVQFNGSGNAMVFENGQAIKATWHKKDDYSPTLLVYADGPNKGARIPFVRGQIFVQIVATGTAVTWTVGDMPAEPSYQ